jgi:hypothetical protein
MHNLALYTVSEYQREEEALQSGEKIESSAGAGATLFRELA